MCAVVIVKISNTSGNVLASYSSKQIAEPSIRNRIKTSCGKHLSQASVDHIEKLEEEACKLIKFFAMDDLLCNMNKDKIVSAYAEKILKGEK